MAAHAFSGPSSRSRHMLCAAAALYESIVKRRNGFITNYIGYRKPALAALFDDSNPAADHGTYLHDQLEKLLVDGEAMQIEDAFELSCMQEIADGLKNDMEDATEYGVEDRLFNDGIDSFGTADFWAIHASTKLEMPDRGVYGGRWLQVADLKTGRGEVDAKENKQGMEYACGVMEKLDWPEDVEYIRIEILAFRFPSSSWVITRQQLLDYWVNELRPSMYATNQVNPVATAGDHCQWCRAKAYCPTFVEHTDVDVINIDLKSFDTVELEGIYSKAVLASKAVDQLKAELILREEVKEFGGKGLIGLKVKPGASRTIIQSKDAATVKSLVKDIDGATKTEVVGASALLKVLKEHPDVLEKVEPLIQKVQNKPSLVKAKS